MDQTLRPFYIRRIHVKHSFESHDQHSTLRGVTSPIYTVRVEHIGSHMMTIAHFLSHMTNAVTVLRTAFIWTTPSAAFVDVSGLVGDAKRLRLPRFDDYLSVSDNLFPFT